MVTQLTRTWSQEYLQLANKGDAKAMYWVGQMYLSGYGTLPQSKQQAASWLSEAIKQGDPEAGAVHNRVFGTDFPEPEKPDPYTTVYAPFLPSSKRSSSSSSSSTSASSPTRAKEASKPNTATLIAEQIPFSQQATPDFAVPARSRVASKKKTLPPRIELPSDEQLRKMSREEREATLVSMFASPDFADEFTDELPKVEKPDRREARKPRRRKK